jgi:hypothetical protein
MSFSPITKPASQLFDSDKNTWIAGYWRGAARVSERSPARVRSGHPRARPLACARNDSGEIWLIRLWSGAILAPFYQRLARGKYVGNSKATPRQPIRWPI